MLLRRALAGLLVRALAGLLVRALAGLLVRALAGLLVMLAGCGSSQARSEQSRTRQATTGQRAVARCGPASARTLAGGAIAAYGTLRCGVDTGSSQVVVRRLTDGRVLRTAGATSGPIGPESFELVGSLVAKRNGSVAWIATARSIVRHGEAVEVHALDSHGNRRLDSGPGIVPRSLQLRGSVLTWVDGHATRSATLS